MVFAFQINRRLGDPRALDEFAMTIDEVEGITGLDFFSDLYLKEEDESAAETKINLDLWPVSQKRYQTRIKHWNHN